MGLPARRLLMMVLVGVFFLQTWLVYSDPAGRQTPPLSVLAERGRQVWHARNCQSCHQIYGFGGFLGPDLTNAVGGLSPARLDSVLTLGSGQMPAFHLAPEDRLAVTAFLEEVDRTGVSQPRVAGVAPPNEHLRNLVELAAQDAPLDERAARGLELVLRESCIACHLPNRQSVHRAKDLTALAVTSGRERVLTVLRDGLPGTAMPRLGMSDADGAAVFAFLEFLHEHEGDIRRGMEALDTAGTLDLARVPWFEY